MDNGKEIVKMSGFNSVQIPHIVFRTNAGLPDQTNASEGEEYKHAYVIEARFDVHEFPECMGGEVESNWVIKIISTDTVAIVKDTDKEDREAALKASWETEDPGRAEEAKHSRLKFVLTEKA